MGKGINNESLVTREKKVAFLQVGTDGKYVRMEGFTSVSTSKSAQEHNRKYVDESSSRTDIVAYEESISYAFDRYKGNEVQQKLIEITDQEKLGADAIVKIVQVDMTTATEAGTTATGRMRQYAVVPDSDGDDANVLTYSGTFKCNGDWTTCTATTDDDWQTVTIS